MPRSSYNQSSFCHLVDHITDIEACQHLPDRFWFDDTIGVYDENLDNRILCDIDSYAKQHNKTFHFSYHQIMDSRIKQKYDNIMFQHSSAIMQDTLLYHFDNYRMHPEQTFEHFLCSFNGSEHESRQFLVSALSKVGLFDSRTVTKNFVNDPLTVEGNISRLAQDREKFYLRLFDTSPEICTKINNIKYDRYNHGSNIYTLESILTKSFLNIVSESLGTSYYPHVSEKCFYSIVTRGLFLCYAQPGWHDHLARYYGFRRYDKIFDYRFDQIRHPLERVVELITMISKFRFLSREDWRDLYELEKDTIEFNYDHFFSKDYVKVLETNDY